MTEDISHLRNRYVLTITRNDGFIHSPSNTDSGRLARTHAQDCLRGQAKSVRIVHQAKNIDFTATDANDKQLKETWSDAVGRWREKAGAILIPTLAVVTAIWLLGLPEVKLFIAERWAILSTSFGNEIGLLQWIVVILALGLFIRSR